MGKGRFEDRRLDARVPVDEYVYVHCLILAGSRNGDTPKNISGIWDLQSLTTGPVIKKQPKGVALVSHFSGIAV
jgi:hypothetical protein